MHVDDLADAVVFLMQNYSDEAHVNVGTGEEVSIRALAETVARTVGVESRLRFDPAKPDGMPRKLLDTGKLRELGWRSRIGREEGLRARLVSGGTWRAVQRDSLQFLSMAPTRAYSRSGEAERSGRSHITLECLVFRVLCEVSMRAAFCSRLLRQRCRPALSTGSGLGGTGVYASFGP